MDYIHYYPRTELEICKSSVSAGDLAKYFDNLRDDENQNTDSSRSVENNYQSISWTRRRARDLRDFYAKSRIKMQCQTGSGTQVPGDLTSLEIPEMKTAEKKKDKCNYDGNIREYSSSEHGMQQYKQSIFEALQKKFDSVQKRKFFQNSFQDEWADYDAWGYDKRAENSWTDVETHEGDVHMNHMGKRKLGSM